jgi:hypothetical protein
MDNGYGQYYLACPGYMITDNLRNLQCIWFHLGRWLLLDAATAATGRCRGTEPEQAKEGGSECIGTDRR